MGSAMESIILMGFLAWYNELGEEEIQDLTFSGQGTAKMPACSVEECSYTNGHIISIPAYPLPRVFYSFTPSFIFYANLGISTLPRLSPGFLDPFQKQIFPMPQGLYQGIASCVSRECSQLINPCFSSHNLPLLISTLKIQSQRHLPDFWEYILGAS